MAKKRSSARPGKSGGPQVRTRAGKGSFVRRESPEEEEVEEEEEGVDPEEGEDLEEGEDMLEDVEEDGEPAETIDEAEEMEDLSAELTEAIGEVQSGGDEVPGRPQGKKRGGKGSSNLRKPGSGLVRGRRTTGRREAPPKAQNRQPGAEIGRMHRSGMSLAVKFSIWISILIILISAAFGLAVVSIFKSKMENEIIRTGYNQVLALEGFSRQVYESFMEANTNPSVRVRPQEYIQDGIGKRQKQYLVRIVEGDLRIYDVAILFSFNPVSPDPGPTTRLMMARNTKSFTPAKKLIEINVEGADPRVEAWRGDYNTDEGTEKVLFFRMPVKRTQRKLQATVNLVLSRKEIDTEVRNLMYKIALFGLVFVGAGIAFSLFLASAVSSPINVLVRDMDIVARGDLDHETRPQTRDEIGLLAREFNRMTRNLREARAQEREVERLNSELKLAEEIHAQLMPEKLPNLPGYDIFTCYHCAKEVGGDYYDFIPVDQEHLAFVIADVSGKGIPGSMVMGTTRTILLMMAAMNLSPADVLSKTNHWVSRDIKRGMFVTAMYVILNVRTREMKVASAGHNPMVVYRAATKSHELVRPNGIALGFDKGPIFNRTVREQSLKLNRGDRVVLYTDGVPECMNENHEEWGDESLYTFVDRYADQTSKKFVRLLTAELRKHQGNADQHDDITVTTFRIE